MGTLITEPASTAPSTTDWQSLIDRTTKQGRGYHQVSIDEMGTTLEPQIMAGSLIENNGAFYLSSVNESISGWSAIPNDTEEVYIKSVVSGTVNSYEFTDTAPTWSDAKQGFYVNNDRYTLIKLSRGATSADYENKRLFNNYPQYAYDEILLSRGFVCKDQVAGSSIFMTNATEHTQQNNTYTEKIYFISPCAGTIRVIHDLKTSLDYISAVSRLYINGVADTLSTKSTTSLTYVTQTYDLTVSRNDKISLYIRNNLGTTAIASATNYGFSVDSTTLPTSSIITFFENINYKVV